MEYSQHAGSGARQEDDGRTSSLGPLTLTDRVAAVFDRIPVERGAEFVPDLLIKMGHERLVAGMYDITTQLTALGYAVDVKYFVRPGSSEPPIITMAIRDDDGGFLYPNINLRLNPAIPRERHEGSANQKLTITAEGEELGFDRKYLPPLEVERFTSEAEVCLLLEESDDADMPYRITPLFSPAGFDQARQHAAEACRNDGANYAVIFHEQIVPAVAQRLHSESEIFGIREVPEIEDMGSNQQGDLLRIRSWIPNGDGSQPIELAYAVELDDLGCRVHSLAG